MKKLLVLISICLLFSSCNEKLSRRSEYNCIEPKDKVVVSISENNVTNLGNIATIYKIKYDDHVYIMFQAAEGVFVIHSPNCTCNQK